MDIGWRVLGCTRLDAHDAGLNGEMSGVQVEQSQAQEAEARALAEQRMQELAQLQTAAQAEAAAHQTRH